MIDPSPVGGEEREAIGALREMADWGCHDTDDYDGPPCACCFARDRLAEIEHFEPVEVVPLSSCRGLEEALEEMLDRSEAYLDEHEPTILTPNPEHGKARSKLWDAVSDAQAALLAFRQASTTEGEKR
jgi:hypothetical protein